MAKPLTHHAIWTAIDTLAEKHGLSPSGLARAAGLDPTTFNRSKRETASGRARWPSTESLAKILAATRSEFGDFARAVSAEDGGAGGETIIPLIGLAQAGDGGFFDDAGFPVGGGWEAVAFPQVGDPNAYALEISGESMLPLYREGDRIIVSPAASVRRGDRVVVKTRAGEILAKLLTRQTPDFVELQSINPDFENRTIAQSDILFIARIIWASQ
ncbi:MAG: helix-turn-helix transcriptional regulator [Parvibaculum sp.]